jgi:RecJ-like exonuclease
MAKIAVMLTDEEGDIEVDLPAKYEVCGRCNGEGKHDHSAFSNGVSREQFDEDPDFEEAYFRGDYDVVCEECKGRTTVLVVDADACKAAGLEKELEIYWDNCREDRMTRREMEAERRMGA